MCAGVAIGKIPGSRTTQRFALFPFPFKIKLIIIPSTKDFSLP